MRESIRKIVSRLRRDKRRGSPAASKAGASSPTSKGSVSSTTTKVVLPPRRKAGATPAPGKKTSRKHHARAARAYVTGQTVFDDRSLRYRSPFPHTDLSALGDPSGLLGVFKIRLAKHTSARRDAGALIAQRYSGRGYAIPVRKSKSDVLTFIAYDEGQIVGTVGLGVATEEGLSADELYRVEIDQLRAKGWRICEFTRLAVDSTAASKPVLAGLFQTAYLYAAVIRGYTHAVIEVNPRHVAFYGRALKFEPVGPERTNKRVNAPAVLLCASFETIAHDLKKYAGKTPAPGTKRTLFHYGFPPEEELGVLARLRELVVAH